MVYLIQQLTLLPESSNSRVYGQPVVVKILNAEYPIPYQLSRHNNEYQFTKNPAIEAGWTKAPHSSLRRGGTSREYPRRNAMKRKLQPAFVILLVIIGLLLTGCGGAPKTKTYIIGVLNPSLNQEDTVKGFKEGMTELGYVEGQNVTYIYDGPVSADKLDAVAQDLVKAKVDLILAITTSATKAAQKATAGTDIAVVFIPVTDPVGAGVVASLTKPGGNTTGVTTSTQEGKRLEWLLQVAPTIKQIYIVYNPKDQSPVLALKTVSETAAKLGVELITREVQHH